MVNSEFLADLVIRQKAMLRGVTRTANNEEQITGDYFYIEEPTARRLKEHPVIFAYSDERAKLNKRT